MKNRRLSEVESLEPKTGDITHPLSRIDSQVIHRGLIIDVREVIRDNSSRTLFEKHRLLFEVNFLKIFIFAVPFAKVDSEISHVTAKFGVAGDLNTLPEMSAGNSDLNPLADALEASTPRGLKGWVKVGARAGHKLLMQVGIFN